MNDPNNPCLFCTTKNDDIIEKITIERIGDEAKQWDAVAQFNTFINVKEDQIKDAKEKGNEFSKQLRRAPPYVRAKWDNEIKDLRRNHQKRYALVISRTTCNTQICLVVTCDCCFVGIHSLSIDFALLAQRP